MRSTFKLWLVTVFCFLVFPRSSHANEVFLYSDNDTFFGTDEEYTGGAGFKFDYHGFTLDYQGRIFTPQDTSVQTPIPGQRPYAAYEKYGARYRDNFKPIYFDVGLYGARTGDELNGEFIQNSIHHDLAKKRNLDPNAYQTNGWPTQISNKTGTQGDLKLGVFHEAGSFFSVLLYGAGETGSFIRSTGYGVTSRLGFNIDKFSDHRYAAKNAFFLEADYRRSHISQQNLLEGNESDYPYAVEIKNEVQQASLSLVTVVVGIKLFVGATYISKEYESQPSNAYSSNGHYYGTAGLGYRW